MATPARPSTPSSGLPHGVRLDEVAFAPRHRLITAVAVVQAAVLAVVAVLAHRADPALWIGLGVVLAACAGGQAPVSQLTRTSLVSLSLMLESTLLRHISHGLTDMHIHFYVMLSLVALYQAWTPFLLAIVLVAGHHLVLGTMHSMAVFSDPVAQRHPLAFALVHAVFLLAMAVALAVGWRYSEQAEAGRREERSRADQQALAQATAQAELATLRADAAREDAERLARREEQAAVLTRRLGGLEEAGRRLTANAGTATAEMQELVSAISAIASAASRATATAHDADTESQTSETTMQRLAATMEEVGTIARSISSIADQTNLLALNATIEAARAGEAGKGFAVVASEVKDLARETAQATERIRGVVDNVQADTLEAAASISRIRGVITQVVQAQGTIADAVEHQTAATHHARQAIDEAAAEADRMAVELRAVAAL